MDSRGGRTGNDASNRSRRTYCDGLNLNLSAPHGRNERAGEGKGSEMDVERQERPTVATRPFCAFGTTCWDTSAPDPNKSCRRRYQATNGAKRRSTAHRPTVCSFLSSMGSCPAMVAIPTAPVSPFGSLDRIGSLLLNLLLSPKNSHSYHHQLRCNDVTYPALTGSHLYTFLLSTLRSTSARGGTV